MTNEITTELELLGHCSVDSGQILIGDPCYLSDFADDSDQVWDLSNKFGEYSYQGASATTLSSEGGGTLGESLAIVVSSGYGDGSYPVYVTRDENGRIATATIVFISDEEDEDE